MSRVRGRGNQSSFDIISGQEIHPRRVSSSSSSSSSVYREPRPFPRADSSGQLHEFGNGEKLQPTLSRTSFQSTFYINPEYIPPNTHSQSSSSIQSTLDQNDKNHSDEKNDHHDHRHDAAADDDDDGDDDGNDDNEKKKKKDGVLVPFLRSYRDAPNQSNPQESRGSTTASALLAAHLQAKKNHRHSHTHTHQKRCSNTFASSVPLNEWASPSPSPLSPSSSSSSSSSEPTPNAASQYDIDGSNTSAKTNNNSNNSPIAKSVIFECMGMSNSPSPSAALTPRLRKAGEQRPKTALEKLRDKQDHMSNLPPSSSSVLPIGSNLKMASKHDKIEKTSPSKFGKTKQIVPKAPSQIF